MMKFHVIVFAGLFIGWFRKILCTVCRLTNVWGRLLKTYWCKL